MGSHKPEGYFEYVVPPLEGLWWQEGIHGADYTRKEDFRWISLIRLPEFVTREVFRQALDRAAEKGGAGFFPGRVFHLGGGALRPVYAYRPLSGGTRHRGRHGRVCQG